VKVLSWVVMATMSETVAHKMQRVEPSRAVIVWRACGERSWKRLGLSFRLCLVPEKISSSNARGGNGLVKGEAGRVPGGGGCWPGKWQHSGPGCHAGWVEACNLLLSIVRFPEGDLVIMKAQGGELSKEISTRDVT